MNAHALTTTELFLAAMALIFALAWALWRLLRTDAPASACWPAATAGSARLPRPGSSCWAWAWPALTADSFTALLLMAVFSTLLTIPQVRPRLARLQALMEGRR